MYPPLLDTIAVALIFIHFSVALAYYQYLKGYRDKPWHLKVDRQYQPHITTIVPTYNEGLLIERRLENLASQKYPHDKLQIIVVDSGSTDDTASIAKKWLNQNPNVNATLVCEPERHGKFNAIVNALKVVQPNSVAVVLTDADAYWESNALSEVTSFLADPEVGSVTGSISYAEDHGALSEAVYRSYFNTVRIAESKIHSTPVHNGPLFAIRTDILRKIGLPNFPGSDDSAFGSLVGLSGHRAIQADAAIVREYVRGNRLRRKVRRAACVLLNFRYTKKYAKQKNLYVRSKFDIVWRMEFWLHAINPWLLYAAISILVFEAIFSRSLLAFGLLLIAVFSLLFRPFRTWMIQQVYLLLGAVRSLWTSETIWDR
jgi:cellulose synthase/poly-beta-1,6-N-acetylglucosamine synthase-like glycosyltransferase